MALADIIAAIKAQADKEIALIQEQATREKDAMKNKANEELKKFEADLQKKTADRKEQMKKKAESAVDMERKKAILTEKRSALDSVYAAAAHCLVPNNTAPSYRGHTPHRGREAIQDKSQALG